MTGSILLIEDNPHDQFLMLRAIEKNGIANPVVLARDGVEALDYLFGTGDYAGRDVSEQPAVILLDLKLPRLDGLEVLQRLRAHPLTRYVPVVVLSSSGEENDVRMSYRLGANSYIRKPVDFDQFNDVVRRLGSYWLLTNEAPPDSLKKPPAV